MISAFLVYPSQPGARGVLLFVLPQLVFYLACGIAPGSRRPQSASVTGRRCRLGPLPPTTSGRGRGAETGVSAGSCATGSSATRRSAPGRLREARTGPAWPPPRQQVYQQAIVQDIVPEPSPCPRRYCQ